jgi:hypothetical protein
VTDEFGCKVPFPDPGLRLRHQEMIVGFLRAVEPVAAVRRLGKSGGAGVFIANCIFDGWTEDVCLFCAQTEGQ